MVKYNIATECCVTKGAERIVVRWSTFPIDQDHQGLDVVFVKLTNPPCAIQLAGLAENVIPIRSMRQDIFCCLPNDEIRKIERMQVQLLPNFGMTDYSAQGRTRPNNVVDLSGCPTYHSYYTALSCSASADGTILLSPIDLTKVTGGISRWLRQEFRELELLDDITTTRYEQVLPIFVNAHRRDVLLNQFLKLKGAHYVPANVHKSIKWSSSDPLSLLSTVDDIVLHDYVAASVISPEGMKKGNRKRKAGTSSGVTTFKVTKNSFN